MKIAAFIIVAFAFLFTVDGLLELSKKGEQRIPNALAVVIAACLVTLVLIINS